jgi:hypothetical protein
LFCYNFASADSKRVRALGPVYPPSSLHRLETKGLTSGALCKCLKIGSSRPNEKSAGLAAPSRGSYWKQCYHGSTWGVNLFRRPLRVQACSFLQTPAAGQSARACPGQSFTGCGKTRGKLSSGELKPSDFSGFTPGLEAPASWRKDFFRRL